MDNFEIEIIFQNVSYLIANKINKLSGNSDFYLTKSVRFFNDLIKSLDSLDNSDQNQVTQDDSYIFFPYLKEVVQFAPNTSQKFSEKELAIVKKYFLGIIDDIERLKNDPIKFYTTLKSDQLKQLADKLSKIHSENFHNHIFETEETLSNSSILC